MKPRRSSAPNPRSDVAAILLGGFGTPPLDGVKHHGFGGMFFQLYEDGDEGIARLWRDHEQYLRSEAMRYGIQPAWDTGDGTLLFYGEFVQHMLQADGGSDE
jgi:hypothetical protein